MGFRNGAYAKVWQVKPMFDTMTNVRISISQKSRKTGEYEDLFSGFVTFSKTENAAAAAKLKEGDRIKLLEVDCTNRYDKEKKIKYDNFYCYAFEKADGSGQPRASTEPQPTVDDGEPEEVGGKPLPF